MFLFCSYCAFIPSSHLEREITHMRTMTYLKDGAALMLFFTAGYVWLVIA